MNEAPAVTRAIQMIVICRDASGSPDAYLTSADVTEEQYLLGQHYEMATSEAESNAYEEPFVVIDANEALFKKLAPIFASLALPADKPCSSEEALAPATGSKRPFYRTTYEVEVLSMKPVHESIRERVDDLIENATDGNAIAYMKRGRQEQLTGVQMADALTDFVGSPDAFGLTADGQDIPGHEAVLAAGHEEPLPT